MTDRSIQSSTEELYFLRDKQVFVFDLDGTLYLGAHLLPDAQRLVHGLRAMGKQVIFYTNNASRSLQVYYDLLNDRGFEAQEKEILSAGDVTIDFLCRHRAGKRVYLLGTPTLAEQFRAAGIPVVGDERPVREDPADIVVSSFDTTLTYDRVWRACSHIFAGAEYFATHPDPLCPTDGYPMPDAGSIAAMLERATGVIPAYFGKPGAHGMDMICERTGVDVGKICMIGDQANTDIAFGKSNGASAVLVLTGGVKPGEVPSLTGNMRPDAVVGDLRAVTAVLFDHAKKTE